MIYICFGLLSHSNFGIKANYFLDLRIIFKNHDAAVSYLMYVRMQFSLCVFKYTWQWT
jgi:hypothetical protein